MLPFEKNPLDIAVKTAVGHMAKVGNMFRSYTESKSCPDDCPLKDSGCYAGIGPVSWVWKKIDNGTAKGMTNWKGFCQKVRRLKKGELWRHDVAGDFPHVDGLIHRPMLFDLVDANKDKDGFSYTHHALNDHNLDALRYANDNGFTVNLSANGMHQVDAYVDTGLPVVTILPIDAPKVQRTAQGRKVVVCPAVNSKAVTCDRCGICANPDRGYVIGFPAHGASKKRAQSVALSEIK